METITNFFQVSAAWMQACGNAAKAKTFIVKDVHQYRDGTVMFVTVFDANGHPWVVDARRGSFVQSLSN